MKERIKIIFVDIDWTILDHKIHDWDYESIEALKKVQDRGVLIYLCTARPFDSVVHTGIFEILNPDGVVATNGGVAFVNDELLFSNVIPEDIVKKTIEVANNHDLVVEMATDKSRYFTAEKNQWVLNYFKSYVEVFPPVIKDKSDNVSAMLLFAPEELDETLIKELPEEIRYFRFDLFGVDLCYHENDKGKAITRVLEHLHIDKEASMGIGDDYGDIPMFEAVGISIAMGNGREEAKGKATYVADTIHEHGINKIFQELGLL